MHRAAYSTAIATLPYAFRNKTNKYDFAYLYIHRAL